MNLMSFDDVSDAVPQFLCHPDIMAAWEARDYVLLEALLQGLARATTREVMDRLVNPLENDHHLSIFQESARQAELATTIANSVASWQRVAPALGN